MINPVDRTEEFAQIFSSHHNVSPNNLKELSSKKDESQLHHVTITALNLKTQIDKMKLFIKQCQAKYIDFSFRGMKDKERDDIDSSVAQFLRMVMNEIDNLKKQAMNQLKEEPGESFIIHWLGLIAILSEELGIVSQLSEGLREIRIRHAIDQKQNQKQIEYNPTIAREMAEEKQNSTKINDVEQDDNNDMQVLEQMFERENATLVNDLIETRERVQQAEKTIVEIAQLNHIFATKVLEQAREIEVLYDLAVESTRFVDRGNKELRKMKDRGPIMKQIFSFCVLVLAFAILFYDWFSGRKSFFFF